MEEIGFGLKQRAGGRAEVCPILGRLWMSPQNFLLD